MHSIDCRRRIPGCHRPPSSLLRAAARFSPPPFFIQLRRSLNPGAPPLPSLLQAPPEPHRCSRLDGRPIPAVPTPVSIAPLRLCFPSLPFLHRNFCRHCSPEKTTHSSQILSVYYPQRRSEGRPQQHLPTTQEPGTGIAPNRTHPHIEQIHIW
jgi:hypothetical protein